MIDEKCAYLVKNNAASASAMREQVIDFKTRWPMLREREREIVYDFTR